jgi:oligopeptide/dipeptide ABC transporter ATP-binding protein
MVASAMIGDAPAQMPAAGNPRAAAPQNGGENTLLIASSLAKHYPTGSGRGVVHAVNGVSFTIRAGEVLGLVGESGSGKSTVARLILRLVEPSTGQVVFDGVDITRLSRKRLRRIRPEMQMVFQDPFDSLNPRMRVEDILSEPLRLNTQLDRPAIQQRVEELLHRVLLPKSYLKKLPSELSGGEAQRLGIGRAIATYPKFLILDEPTSSIDLAARKEILALLMELRNDLGLTYVMISHDLYTVAALCDRVMVMYLGMIMEEGTAKEVFEAPQHPYTQALLSARLSADPRIKTERHVLSGEIPSAIDMPPGCLFASRCPLVRDDCLAQRPASYALSSSHRAACVRIPQGSNHLADAPPAAGASLELVGGQEAP